MSATFSPALILLTTSIAAALLAVRLALVRR